MVGPGTVILRMDCRCAGAPRVAAARLGRAMLRRLAEGGAPADLVVATTWCSKCKTETVHHLGDLVPWRDQAA